MDEKRARKLVDTVLSLTSADDCRVNLRSGRRTHLRFANNQGTTSGTDEDQTVGVTVSFGARSGTATTNQLDDASLAEVVQAAEALARVSPEDPEHMPTLPGQTYTRVMAWKPGERRDAVQAGVAKIVGLASNAGLKAAGYVEEHQGSEAVGTKNGAFAWHRSTVCTLSTTVRTPDGDGSGWASGAGRSAEEIDWEGVGRTAIEKAEASVGARPLEPGRYVTVFEPSAVASLVNLWRWSLDRRQADEGRSWLSRPDGGVRLGEAIFPSWMSLVSSPTDGRAPVTPFDGEGLAHMPTIWVQEGRLVRLSCGRWWGREKRVGHKPPPSNLILLGGKGTTADLIAKTERGVLVTSLWYIRQVDPRTLLHTGLTRDGLFWIEDGKVSHPLTNMRWNDSPLEVLGKALDASEPVLALSRKGDPDTVVPALRTEAFHFTSASDAV